MIVPEWPCAPSNILSLSTTRRGGVSPAPYDDGAGGGGLNLGGHVGDAPEHVAQNRALLRSRLPAEPVWLSQVHSTQVLDADLAVPDVSGKLPEADASVATRPNVVCVIQTADCLPVLLCDTDGRVVGAAHAGWKGLAVGVLEHTLQAMRDRGAQEIMAWLGPAIGPQQFEVGEDVLGAFAKVDSRNEQAFRPIEQHPGKYLADIYWLARNTLARNGIHRVSGGGCCTVSDRERFFSYRRDKVTGRMASMIWITKSA